MSLYTVYQLNEKRNKFGNPYIGFTDNLIRRSKQWKKKLQLDYLPELIPLYTDTSGQRAFDWEQDKRVENGWNRERPLRHLRKMHKNAGKVAKESGQISNLAKTGIPGKIGGKITYQQKKGLFSMSEEKKLECRSKAGKVTGRNNVESGHLESVRSIERVCPHCGKTIKGGNYFKWHGDNCKAKPQ